MALSSILNPQLVINSGYLISYVIIFLLMIIEGPIITVIASFLASLGIFNIYIIFILSILGSFFPDLICFGIGRYGQGYIQKKIKSKKSLVLKTLQKMLVHIEKNPLKTIAIIKIVPPLPVWGLILTGTTKMNFKKFIYYILIVGIPYALFFSFIGFYSGVTFTTLLKYLKIGQNLLFFAVPFLILIVILVNITSKKMAKRMEKFIDGKNKH